MRKLASAYTHLEGIRIDDKERELSQEDLKRTPFVKPEPKGCANLFQGKVKIPKYESATWGTRPEVQYGVKVKDARSARRRCVEM